MISTSTMAIITIPGATLAVMIPAASMAAETAGIAEMQMPDQPQEPTELI